MKKISINIYKFESIFVVFFIVTIWYIVSVTGYISHTLLATPEEVLLVFKKAFMTNASLSEQVHMHAYYTIKRALEGWFYGLLIGTSFGVLVGSIAIVYNISEPIIEFIRAIPPILVFPLFLVAFNYGDSAYIWTIVFGCVPVMLLTVAKGTIMVSESRLEILKIFNVNKWIKYFSYTMEVLPSIFLGARITLSIAIIITIVSEMVFTPRSGFALGALARDAEIDFNTPLFYASVLIIGTFGYLSNIILHKLEHYFK